MQSRMWEQMASTVSCEYVDGRPVFLRLSLEAAPLVGADGGAEGFVGPEVDTAVVAETVRFRLFPFGDAGRRAFLGIRGFHLVEDADV